jgi:integrase
MLPFPEIVTAALRSRRRACDEARKVHVHATRKSCASLLVALDVRPRVAMQILRHSQISVTMKSTAQSPRRRRARRSRSSVTGWIRSRCCMRWKRPLPDHGGGFELGWGVHEYG